MVLDIEDQKGEKIRLTKEQWTHIREDHPNIEDPEEISQTILQPDKIINDEREGVVNFFKYFKHKKWRSKFLKVIVRYLNGDGFVISAHFVRNIR